MTELRITLKAARVNAGLTAKEAAKQLHISVGTLWNYESGNTVPDWDMVKTISNLYQIPADNIFFGHT